MDSARPVDAPERARTLDTQASFLVQAPAGSGKTELLIRRLLKLLAEVDEPEQILAITFTIAATAEMRARVLDALHQAAEGVGQGGLAELARAALANDAARGWKLLEQPERLNISTIDAVCLTIAHATPLLSRLGGSLSPTDKPQPLYHLAARRTLAHLGDGSELSSALHALLQLRSTSLAACEDLIADILDKRDQWGRALPFETPWAEVRSKLEEPLRRLHQHALQKAQSLFSSHPELEMELMSLVNHACENLDADAYLMQLRGMTQLYQLTNQEHWRCLSEFLLTKGATWRKRAPTGILSGAAKARFIALIAELDARPALKAMLETLQDLPPCAYSEEESQMLQQLLVILHYAAAELRVVFAERKMVDFVELGLAAWEVLSNEEGRSSELAADIAGRWKHLLVDEFQDTSRTQYRLLTLLAEGWESAERGTCFLVGDPMQSIYMFRQAEVELFERTRRFGLGEGTGATHLSPVQLRTNFRSHAGLVEPLNEIFRQVFAQDAEEESYHVAFEPSTAHDAAPSKAALRIWPSLLSSKATPEQYTAAAEAEALQVVRIIQERWPQVDHALSAGKEFKIAVLVRAKSHLALIAKRLREADIPFAAVEIEQLGERQEVQDLTALTRALLHPMDRIAWLSVLRAPWCGLTLLDLHTLCGSDEKVQSKEPVLTLLRQRISLLSEDGQQRAGRSHSILENALRGQHRQVSLARWVERTWATLGGNACVDRTAYENVRTFFAMLEDLGPDAGGLQERIEELCAQPDPHADPRRGVQLMTIHKAKGLGFDVVIVPGLERATQGDSQGLLNWIEQTRLVGPFEEEEREFVVAPIGRNGESSGIYRWIGKQHARRQDDEAKRLLYVAATRAGRELHLLGTATIKTQRNGVRDLGPGEKHSLLGIAWDAVRGDFDRFYAESLRVGARDPEQIELEFPERISTIRLRRLPVGWRPPAFANGVGVRKDAEVWERPQGSLAARAFGTVVHGLMEDLAKVSGIEVGGVLPEVLRQVDGWRGRALALLRGTGLARGDAESQADEVVKALLGVLNDPVGRWILGARTEGETEVSWSAWGDDDVVRTLRGDRVFRAGDAPGSVDETHLWIVDYKTTRHGAGGLDGFLLEEKEKYRPQLEAYAGVMRKVHGEEAPLRLALYYPLLRRLVWW